MVFWLWIYQIKSLIVYISIVVVVLNDTLFCAHLITSFIYVNTDAKWLWFLLLLICVFIHFITAAVQLLIMFLMPPDCFLVQRPLSSLWPALWFSSSVTAWSEKKEISAANKLLCFIMMPPTLALQWQLYLSYCLKSWNCVLLVACGEIGWTSPDNLMWCVDFQGGFHLQNSHKFLPQ